MKTSYRHCAACNRLHDADAWPHEIEATAAYDPSSAYDEFMHGPRTGTFRQCRTCGGRHEISQWPHNCMPEAPQESDLDVCRNFISDNLESIGGLNGVQSQANGRHYTSKKLMRDDYKARGLVEMGNDKAPAFKKQRPKREQVKAAVEKAWHHAVNDGAKAENFVKQRKKHEQTPFGRIAPAR